MKGLLISKVYPSIQSLVSPLLTLSLQAGSQPYTAEMWNQRCVAPKHCVVRPDTCEQVRGPDDTGPCSFLEPSDWQFIWACAPSVTFP